MPKVPTYDSFQTNAGIGSPNDFTARGFDIDAKAAVSPEQAAIPGEQMQKFGQSIEHTFKGLGDIAIRAQEHANSIRVDDAIDQLKNAQIDLEYGTKQANGQRTGGYSQTMGIDAFQRQSGKTLADDYGEEFKNKADSILQSLGNDAQKESFTKAAQTLGTQFRESVDRHEQQQFRTYVESVRQSSIATAQDEMVLKYNDPSVIDSNIKTIQAATYDLATMQGKSPSWAEIKAKEMVSSSLGKVINTAISNNNLEYASGVMGKYSKHMTADDLLKSGGELTKQKNNQTAFSAANDTLKAFVPRIVTSDQARLTNLVFGAESATGQFNPDGSVVTSPKGAIGAAQVMPSTGPEAAKLAKLPWDENKFRTDPAYNKALGAAYLDKQIRDFGGNEQMAVAAYNAGPGAVRQALKDAQADPNKPNWLDHLPSETRAYVPKIMSQYQSGQGAYPKPTLVDLKNAAMKNPAVANNPDIQKATFDKIEKDFNDVNKALKQREDEAVARASQELVANGGSWTNLNPNTRMSIPAEKVDGLMNFAARIAKGDDRTNEGLYQKLATDKNFLKNMSDTEFFALRPELSQSDFQKFADMRGNLKKGESGQSVGDLNTDAANRTLNDSIRILGMDPTPKDGTTAAKQVGTIRRYVFNALLDAQSQSGKKFTDRETADFINGMFIKDSGFKKFFGGSIAMMGVTASDIPSNIKKQLKANLKAQGISDATDEQIVEAYWKTKNAMPNGATGKF